MAQISSTRLGSVARAMNASVAPGGSGCGMEVVMRATRSSAVCSEISPASERRSGRNTARGASMTG